jgi:hypothetical protein
MVCKVSVQGSSFSNSSQCLFGKSGTQYKFSHRNVHTGKIQRSRGQWLIASLANATKYILFFKPLSCWGGYLNFSVVFMKNILFEQKKIKMVICGK